MRRKLKMDVDITSALAICCVMSSSERRTRRRRLHLSATNRNITRAEVFRGSGDLAEIPTFWARKGGNSGYGRGGGGTTAVVVGFANRATCGRRTRKRREVLSAASVKNHRAGCFRNLQGNSAGATSSERDWDRRRDFFVVRSVHALPGYCCSEAFPTPLSLCAMPSCSGRHRTLTADRGAIRRAHRGGVGYNVVKVRSSWHARFHRHSLGRTLSDACCCLHEVRAPGSGPRSGHCRPGARGVGRHDPRALDHGHDR